MYPFIFLLSAAYASANVLVQYLYHLLASNNYSVDYRYSRARIRALSDAVDCHPRQVLQ